MSKLPFLATGAIKLSLMCIFSFFFKKKYWLICEKKNEARDNGIYLFLYCLEEMKNHDVFYVIDRDSYDIGRLEKYINNVIYTNSFKHCLYYFLSKKIISSQSLPFPYSEKLCRKLFKVKNQKYYWLQHGVTKDKLNHADMDKKSKGYSLVCCAAPDEAQFFCDEFGYDTKSAVCTGFCRFDGLVDNSSNNTQILIMPTFRKWLTTSEITNHPTEKEENSFLNSHYYQAYHSLLKNDTFNTWLKKNNIIVYFYQHYAFQTYSYLFADCKNSNIIVADCNGYDVQKLMKDSNLLITDYSSVFFDFAYMKKPELFYHFDENEYRASHYKEGFFSYRNHGFGKVIMQEEELINEIINSFSHGFIIDPFYLDRVQGFFQNIDKNNCKRVYDLLTSN